MRYVIQHLLNEFIERDFSTDEMARVLTDIADLEGAEKALEDPKRYLHFNHDLQWRNSCRECLKNTLESLALEDYEDELL